MAPHSPYRTLPRPGATRLAFSRVRPTPPPRTFRAARRPRRRRHRGRPDAGHLLPHPSPSPRRPARSSRGAGVMGGVEHPTGPLRPARSHRALPPEAALTACGRARTLAQHGQPRAAAPRRQEAHLPQRLCRAALEGQDPPPVQPDRPGVQRPAPVEERTPRGCRRSAQGLERRRQGRARPTPAAACMRRAAVSECLGGAAAVAAGFPTVASPAAGLLTAPDTAPPAAGLATAPDTAPPAAGFPATPAAAGRLRGACRSRARLQGAPAARSDPRAGRRTASRAPAESGQRSTRRPRRRASRDRSTRPTRDRRGAT
jgi:hypothetical protein